MDLLESVTHKLHDGYFVDLFVRQSNSNAIGMYTKVQSSSDDILVSIWLSQFTRRHLSS
jgi:ribosomal protein S18 acetylase RimI-like enzyme